MEKPANDVDLGMPDLTGEPEQDLGALLAGLAGLTDPLGQVVRRVVYGHGDPNSVASTFDSALPPDTGWRPARRDADPRGVAHGEDTTLS
ncbi:hypothetical protein ACGF3G_43155 [Streptomyces sp. NPDC048179]|uniref:hypothetical protein n=1 Tax=Streptomyces sp. NPDC048179 TaxID=3365506 RepID=UPI0037179DE7